MPLHNRRYTLAVIRMLRAAGPLPRRRRIPRQQQPDLLRKAYFDAILPYLVRAETSMRVTRDEIVRMLADERRDHMDESKKDRAKEFVENAQRRFEASWEPHELNQVAMRFAHRTSDFQREQLNRQVVAAMSIPLSVIERPIVAKLEAFAAENVRLLKTVPERYFERIQADVEEAFETGMHPDTLAETFVSRDGMIESDARRIARDQIGKLNAQLNEERQQAMGVTSYIWRTANDNRVRDEHSARDGRRYEWAKPPDDGNPGEPVQCRCYAEPVFDEILGEAEE